MITLDIDLSYFSRYYHISSEAIKQYQQKNMSIPQIMQAEALKGNEAAAKFMAKISGNPELLVQLYQLTDPKNRFLILSHMNQEDLAKIMECLEPDELILGLSIFTQEALVELMMKLPPETLSTVVLENMDTNKFLDQLPEEHMDAFLSSEKIDRNMFMIGMQDMEDSSLQKMMEKYSGQPCYDNRETIMGKMNEMDDKNFQRAIMGFEEDDKKQLIGNMLQAKPDLFEEFSPEAMVEPFKAMEKEDVLKALTVLDTEELMPMVEDLPQDIMALIATQIDPAMFAQILTSDFKDIIASCGIDS
ncbi:MAG: hypothetical protein E7Z90_06650 [Cyanobacteria bacterium SIG29]|nr:hypothetical protein [Cyanobacteria bacterium SIG29]